MNSHQKGLHLNLMRRNMDMSKAVENKKPPLCKGRWVCEVNSEGLKKSKTIPQSATLTAPVLPPLMRSIKGGGPPKVVEG